MNKFFKVNDSKIPLEKDWNNTGNHPLADLSDWIKNGRQIGWVVPKGYIVVDIDNSKVANKILDNIFLFGNCGVNKTPRGLHLIYKAPRYKIKNSSNKFVAGYINVDYRTAGKGYIVWPTTQKDRKVLREVKKDLDIMPEFFRPLYEENQKTLLDIREGSRNDLLYNWSVSLFNKTKDAVKIMTTINSLLDYPLDTAELNKLIGSAKKFTEENPLTSDSLDIELEIANKIKDNFWFDNFFWYEWAGTHWVKTNITKVQKAVFESVDYKIKANTLNGVIIKLKSLTYHDYVKPPKNEINTLSGVYNVETKTLRKVEKKDYFTYLYNAEIKETDTEELEKIIKKMTPDFDLLLLMLGHFLHDDNRLTEQAFMFKGTREGGNGKDTFLNLIRATFGYTSIEFETLNTGRFYLAGIEGENVLIDTDYNNKVISQSSNFKKIVSGTPLKAEVKNVQQMKDIISNATLIICTNLFPSVDSGSAGGFFRRWSIIKFPHNLRKNGGNPKIKLKLSDGTYNNALMQLALKGYENLKEKHFLFPETPDIDVWEGMNEPVKTWMLSTFDVVKDSQLKSEDIFKCYLTMCEQENFKNPYNKALFFRKLNETFPEVTQTRNRKQGTVYNNIAYNQN